jgi:hypothetical protein
MPLTVNNQNINLSSWITHLLIQELNDNNPGTIGIITDFLEHHGNTLPIVNNYINNIYGSPYDSPPNDSPPNDSPPNDSPPNGSPPNDSPNDSPPNGSPPNGSPPNGSPNGSPYNSPNDSPNGSPYDPPNGSPNDPPNGSPNDSPYIIPDLDDQDLYDTDYSSDDGYDSPTSITDFPNHVIP